MPRDLVVLELFSNFAHPALKAFYDYFIAQSPTEPETEKHFKNIYLDLTRKLLRKIQHAKLESFRQRWVKQNKINKFLKIKSLDKDLYNTEICTKLNLFHKGDQQLKALIKALFKNSMIGFEELQDLCGDLEYFVLFFDEHGISSSSITNFEALIKANPNRLKPETVGTAFLNNSIVTTTNFILIKTE